MLVLEKRIAQRRANFNRYMQPVFKAYEFYGGSVCEDLFNYGLCLPSGSNLNENDWQRIENQITIFFS